MQTKVNIDMVATTAIAGLFLICLGLAIPATNLTSATTQLQSLGLQLSIGYLLLSLGRYCFTAIQHQHQDIYLWALATCMRLNKYRSWGYYFQLLSHAKLRQLQLFLVLGNKNSGKSCLLSNTGAIPLENSSQYQHNGCIYQRWWQGQDCHYLESTCLMNEGFSSQPAPALQTYWGNLLSLLQWQHQAKGFNGLILTISAQNILFNSGSHPSQCLRGLCNQAKLLQQLQPHIPLYIVITNFDKVPGFDHFFQFLDQRDFEPPFGFTLNKSARNAQQWQQKMANISHEIENFMIYLLEKAPEHNIKKIHEFVRHFQQLQEQIQTLYTQLQAKHSISGLFYLSNRNEDNGAAFNRSLPSPENFNDNDLTVLGSQRQFFSRKILDSIIKQDYKLPSQKACVGIALVTLSYFATAHMDQLQNQLNQIITTIYQPQTQKSKSHVTQTNPGQPISVQKKLMQFNEIFQRNTQLILQAQQQVNRWQNSLDNMTNSIGVGVKKPKANQQDNLLQQQWQEYLSQVQPILKQCDPLSLCLGVVLQTLQQGHHLNLDPQLQSKLPIVQQKMDFSGSSKLSLERVLPDIQNALKTSNDQTQIQALLELLLPGFDHTQEHSSAEIEQHSAIICQLKEKISIMSPWQELKNPDHCQQQVSDQWLKKINQRHQQSLTQWIIPETENNFSSLHQHITALRENLDFSQVAIKKSLAQNSHIKNLSPQLKQVYSLLQNSTFDKTQMAVLDEIHSYTQALVQSADSDQSAYFTLAQLANSNQEPLFLQQRNHNHLAGHYSHRLWQSIQAAGKRYLNKQWQQQIFTPFQQQLSAHYPFNPKASTSTDLKQFTNFFSPSGILEKFIDHHLQPFLQGPSTAKLQLKPIFTQHIFQEEEIVPLVIAHKVIQKMYFSSSKDTPWFEAQLKYNHASSGIRDIIIMQDDQSQRLNLAKPETISIKWPFAKESFGVQVQLDSGQRITLATATGPWAMLRVLQQHLQHQDSKPRLVFTHYDKQIELLLLAQAPLHPLSTDIWSQFRLPQQLVTTARQPSGQ